MVGRKPLPEELHRLEKPEIYGEVAARIQNTPKPKKEMKPRCPQRLTKKQRKEWRFYASILKNYGLFTVANAPLLELLAVNTDQYKECLDMVQTNGILIKSPNDYPIYNPYWTAMNKLEGKIIKILSELGLSSTGLAKIGSYVSNSQRRKSEMEELID